MRAIRALLAVVFLLWSAAASAAPQGEMVITFDDLPTVRIPDRVQRLIVTDQLLTTLKQYGVKATGFVIGDNVGEDADLLQSWLTAGHALGTHTYSHPDLNELPSHLYVADIARCSDLLRPILFRSGARAKFFRYPYLHYGLSPESKQEILAYLKGQDLTVAHVSVDPEDYIFNLQFDKAYQAADSTEMIRVGQEYIAFTLSKLDGAEKLAHEIMGRPIRHILLLHANRLNGRFLADLLEAFKRRGYRFISLERALADQVYSLPEAYFGPQGLTYLERISRSDPDRLPARE